MPVTRQDVADRARVSSAVVSYVVNDGPRPVAAATRERVLRAVEELGYRPNAVARSLKTRRTGALAFLVPDTANAYFAQLVREVELAASRAGYTLLIGNTMDDLDREAAYAATFVERRVDGVLLVPALPATRAVRIVADAGVPVVTVDRLAAEPVSRVAVDNRVGGLLATRHLLGHGHRRIGILQGPAVLPTVEDRRAGWAEALAGAGIEPAPGWTASTSDFSRAAAWDAATRLLAAADRPTAVFVTADEQALGVYRAARSAGLAIPEDLAVVSFDSAETAPYLFPSLSAVGQPIVEMAETAVRRLIERIADPAELSADVLDVQLVPRGSCGCPDPEPATVLADGVSRAVSGRH